MCGVRRAETGACLVQPLHNFNPSPHPSSQAHLAHLSTLLTSLTADAAALHTAWTAALASLRDAASASARGAVDHAELLADAAEQAADAADQAAAAADAAASAGAGLTKGLRGVDGIAESVARVRRRLDELEARVGRVLG